MFGACAECGSEAYLTGLLCRECAVQLGYVEPECDVCAAHPESVSWCGDCGCCVQHCQGFVDCSTTTVKGSV